MPALATGPPAFGRGFVLHEDGGEGGGIGVVAGGLHTDGEEALVDHELGELGDVLGGSHVFAHGAAFGMHGFEDGAVLLVLVERDPGGLAPDGGFGVVTCEKLRAGFDCAIVVPEDGVVSGVGLPDGGEDRLSESP